MNNVKLFQGSIEFGWYCHGRRREREKRRVPTVTEATLTEKDEPHFVRRQQIRDENRMAKRRYRSPFIIHDKLQVELLSQEANK